MVRNVLYLTYLSGLPCSNQVCMVLTIWRVQPEFHQGAFEARRSRSGKNVAVSRDCRVLVFPHFAAPTAESVVFHLHESGFIKLVPMCR